MEGDFSCVLLWWDESCFLIVAARVRVLGKEEEERRVSISSGKHKQYSSSKYTTSSKPVHALEHKQPTQCNALVSEHVANCSIVVANKM